MNEKHLTAHQRAVLIDKALTQGDLQEAERLISSAPISTFTGPNPMIAMVLIRIQTKRRMLFAALAEHAHTRLHGERDNIDAELAAVDAVAMADRDLCATWEPAVELFRDNLVKQMLEEGPDEVREIVADALEALTPPEPDPERIAYYAELIAPYAEPAPAQMDA
jgi:hypothetical protein